MYLIARTAPEAPEKKPQPTPWQLARGITVVSGGPVALAALSVLAPLSAARRWPNRLPSGLPRGVAWAVTGTMIAFPGVYGSVVRPWLQHWGSTEEERRRRYPGDGDAKTLSTVTRAVTVHAPAEQVWQWLVQIGEDRGGFYSYDWLENLAGCHLRSAESIHEEWQDLRPGDKLVLFYGTGPDIESVDPPRSLLIKGWGAYVVEPLDQGSCRLVARSHMDRSPPAVGYLLTMELPHAIMERRMMLGIKNRAEQAVRRSTA